MSKPIITSPNFRLRAVALAASCSLLLVGCGGGSGSSSSGTTEPEPPRQDNLAAIEAAKTTLTLTQNAFTELPADATDQQKLEAQQAIHTAATQLIATLRSHDGSQEDITAAETVRDAAEAMVTDLTAKIAEAERIHNENLAAINPARTALTDAQSAYAALPADATDQQKLEAQRAIHTAATQLIATLRSHDGSQEDITAAETVRDAAQGMVTELETKIARDMEEAERMQMIADQTQVITDALTELNTALAALSATDPTAEQVQAVSDARAALQAAVTAGTLVPAQSKVDAQVAIATSKIEIDNANRRIQMAKEEAERRSRQEAAITAAETVLTNAETAFTNLGADATDQQKLEAQQAIHTAATQLINTLRANQGSQEDITAAIAKQTSAQTMITQLQGAIADAAAEQERQRMAAITTAKIALTTAEAALTALPANATDQQKLEAQQAIHTAATTLIATLQANQGSQEDITTAVGKQAVAQSMITQLETAIAAAATEQERQRMAAINTARTALTDAQSAFTALPADATDQQKLEAQQAIHTAATQLINTLQANQGSQEDIDAAGTVRAAAETMVNNLTAKIARDKEEAERMQMIADQTQDITDALAELDTALAALSATDPTAEQVQAVSDARAALQAAVTAGTLVPAQSKVDAQVAIATSKVEIDNANRRIQMAMEEERMAAITTAKTALTTAETAFADLDDDATDQQKLDAQRAIHTAATTLISTLQANEGSQDDINTAIGKKAVAEAMILQLETAIAAADAQEQLRKTGLINAAKTALTDAETAFTDLDDDATDQQKLDAQRAIHTAATNLIATLNANDGSQDDITAAEMKRDTAQGMVTELEIKIAKMKEEAERTKMMADQTQAITDALTALNTALDELSATEPTTEQVDAVTEAKNALQAAVTAGTLVPADNKAKVDSMVAIGIAETKIKDANRTIASNNNAAKQATIKMAEKLFDGIASRSTVNDANRRNATYGTGSDADKIQVLIGTADGVNLSEDENTPVPDLYGWKGKRYHAEPDGNGTYEAHVYSNAKVVEGKKFGRMASPSDNYKYQLDSDGRYSLAAELDNNAKAKSTEFPAVGTKTIKRDDDSLAVEFTGTYDGVQGTYRCAVVASDNTCTVTVAANGFTFAATGTGSGWFFKPTDPNEKVKSDPSTNFASYGWWSHETEDEKDFLASSFTDLVAPATNPTVATATGVDSLNGKATYSGGAAGKYALYNPLDKSQSAAGHFTAKVNLEANFDSATETDRNISGTINTFRDGDKSLNWSVKLQGLHNSKLINTALLSNTGSIDSASVSIGGVSSAVTPVAVWTIDEAAASHRDSTWSLQLYNSVDSGEDPTAVGNDNAPEFGTGLFYTEYGGIGKMVGAFGVNLDD